MTPSDLERFYDAVADEFESDYYSDAADPFLRFDVLVFTEVLSRVVDEVKPANALEIGCGSGYWLAWLEARGIRATGVDVSSKMCERARHRGLEAYHADAADLPMESATFDLVISPYCALDHCEDFAAAFKEITRVAQPGAVAVLMVDNARRLISRYWHVTHARVHSLGGDPRNDQRWRHEVDGAPVSVYTKMFTRGEIADLLPEWDLTLHGIGLASPLLSKATGRWLPRASSRTLLRAVAPIERWLCRRHPERAALGVYVGTRRER